MRPDLEALAKAFLCKLTSGEWISVEEMVSQVAAHERARIVAQCRAKARSRESVGEDLVLWQFADELEAER